MYLKLESAPLGLPGVPVLDQVEGLERAEGRQQLPALLLVQVVGQAAHKHAVRRVHAARLPRQPAAAAARLRCEKAHRLNGVRVCAAQCRIVCCSSAMVALLMSRRLQGAVLVGGGPPAARPAIGRHRVHVAAQYSVLVLLSAARKCCQAASNRQRGCLMPPPPHLLIGVTTPSSGEQGKSPWNRHGIVDLGVCPTCRPMAVRLSAGLGFAGPSVAAAAGL